VSPSKIAADRTGLGSTDPTRFYLSIFDYGLYRSTETHSYEQVFASAGGGTVAASISSRTEFALAPNGDKLRIYLGGRGRNRSGGLLPGGQRQCAGIQPDQRNRQPGMDKTVQRNRGHAWLLVLQFLRDPVLV
jgi:hypothetical protein